MKKIDKVIFYSVTLLLLLGILFVYSSSYYISLKYTNNPYYFLIRQSIWAVLSFIVFIFFSNYDYLKLKKHIKPFILITIVLLLSVFIPGVGRVSGGARRWINLGLFSLNPSEIAKLTVIIYLSYILTKKQSKLVNFTFGLLPPLLLVTAVFFVILMQSNFSTATLLLLVSFVLFFTGGASIKHIFSIFITSLPILITFIIQVSYRKIRILSFLNPWEDINGNGYHIIQSLRSFAEGGFWGVGLGNSVQKMGKLPTPHTDFIFSVIAEEIGFIGAFLIALIYMVIFLRGILIANRCENKFGQLLAFGITSMIALHAFLNMSIAAGIIPPTGIPLPFISYGGSSMIIMAASCGILMNISSYSYSSSTAPAYTEIENIIQESF